MKPVATLLILSGCLATACGYQPAPKPPGYDSISEAQADGVPPILTEAQLEGLSEQQLQQRMRALDRIRRFRPRNPGMSSVLDSQYDQASERLKVLQATP